MFELNQTIMLMAACGADAKYIAYKLGITEQEVLSTYQLEYEVGHMDTVVTAASKVYAAVLKGDVRAAMWWLEKRGRWGLPEAPVAVAPKPTAALTKDEIKHELAKRGLPTHIFH